MSRQLRAILLLPFTVTLIIPTIILLTTRSVHPAWKRPFPQNALGLLTGVGLLMVGLALLIGTVRLFIRVGEGTLAPWDPTRKLVVVGVYRYVRNPMISGVVSILLGEAILLGSPPLLVWCALAFGVNVVYIPLSEEPGLMERFGDDYRLYRQHVPRWIPRLIPWTQPQDASLR